MKTFANCGEWWWRMKMTLLYSIKIFEVKTLTNRPETPKFANVFTCKNFPLYGITWNWKGSDRERDGFVAVLASFMGLIYSDSHFICLPYHLPCTDTTRSPRPGEQNGRGTYYTCVSFFALLFDKVHVALITLDPNTVGYRLSKLRLSECLIIWTLGRHHVFSSSGKKTFQSLGSFYKRKQSCCMNDFSGMLQRLFHPVRDFSLDLQCLSLLSEAANAVVHCITVWKIKRRGR